MGGTCTDEEIVDRGNLALAQLTEYCYFLLFMSVAPDLQEFISRTDQVCDDSTAGEKWIPRLASRPVGVGGGGRGGQLGGVCGGAPQSTPRQRR